jgi:acetyl-CoA synthetase
MVKGSSLVPPPRSPSGRLPFKTEAEYRVAYRAALADPGSYWVSAGSALEWASAWPPPVAMEGSLAEGFRYFPGATGNASVSCVDRHAAADAGRLAILWIGEDGSERRWTYGELAEATRRAAGGLARLGVGKGDVVAIFLPNLLETFAAVHACYRLGAIYNIIFSGFSAEALADRIVDTGAKVVITADHSLRRGQQVPLKAKLDSVADRLPSVEHVVVVRRGQADVPMRSPRDLWWDQLLDGEEAEAVMVEANEPGFIIYTSGTSAQPKGLVHAGLGFLVGAYHNTLMSLDLGPEDMYWCTADTGWLTFPIFEIVGATALGASMIAYEGALDYPGPDRFYQICETHRVTKVFTAPTAVRMLARHGVDLARGYDLSRLRLVSLVGEPLDAQTWHWLADELGEGRLEVNNTYGQSETGSAWCSSVVGVTAAKPGSSGLPLPGHAFSIVDDGGQPVPEGTVGYLLLTQPFPALFRGIWRDPERYRREYFSSFGPDRYETADAALQDGDGHIWVVGRVDGVINVAAHRLSTMEMESALLSNPGVAEAAVVGVPDEVKGQVPVAFVTPRAGYEGSLSPDALARRIVDAIGPIAKPAAIYVLTTMPRTRSGKIVRRLLRELVISGEATGDLTGLEDPEVLDRLKGELAGASARR